MAKAKSLSISADDFTPSKASPLSATRQRGVTASHEFVSLGFKLPPDFIHHFKRAALNRRMKLNEFLIYLFREFEKSENRD
jgi:hypothetical protein